MTPNPNKVRAFETPQAFYNWLAKHHTSETELWLKIYKKSLGQQIITWNEAVIEALCWGWIDSIKKTFDATAYLQRFTPRRKGSVWSKRNREHVERLIKAKRMQEAGMVHVREAQADGRWDKAYAPASEMTVPEDFLVALEHHPDAKAFFETLNKTNRYAVAYRLSTAKKPETRQKRFDKLLEMLKRGETLH